MSSVTNKKFDATEDCVFADVAERIRFRMRVADSVLLDFFCSLRYICGKKPCGHIAILTFAPLVNRQQTRTQDAVISTNIYTKL